MLAADKQLLDARLRNELQQLRRLELTNVVNRFQNALTPATLIAGFSFTGIVELEFTDEHKTNEAAKSAEPLFYISAALSLSLALYVTAVSSMGIVFGQRLTVQATAEQGYEHDATVRELNSKFLSVLIALGASMFFIIVAAIAVILVKDPTALDSGMVSIIAGVFSGILFLLTLYAMCQMFSRLHTPSPQTSKLSLRTGKGKSYADVSEFYVGNDPPPAGFRKRPQPSDLGTAKPDERSNLLPCLERDGKSDVGAKSPV